MSLLTLFLGLFSLALANAAEPGCLELNITIPDYCDDISKSVFEHYRIFVDTPFGSPEIANLNTDLMKKICDRYRNCPKTNKVNCWLPQLPAEQEFVCNRVYALQSSFGRCMRKYLTDTPSSNNLRILFKDLTPESQQKKCELLRRHRHHLGHDIKVECGEDSEWSFNAMRHEIHGFYDCNKYIL